MSDAPIWRCEFYQLSKESPPLDALTVGAKFGWRCQGEIAVEWAPGAPSVQFPDAKFDHSLKILQVLRQEPKEAAYVVTAYKPGQHQPEYLRVMQGSRGFEASKPQWQVKSVLQPNTKPEAYPPFGPWSLSLPLWFFISLAAVSILVVWLIVRQVRRYHQRRRMLEELARHKTAMPPLHQFYRDARQIRRRLHDAKTVEDLKNISVDLNKEFRLFLLREFEIPTLDWSDRAILEDLRRRHSHVYEGAGDSVKRTLRELLKLSSRPNVLLQDVEQLHRMSLDTAEKLGDALEGKRA